MSAVLEVPTWGPLLVAVIVISSLLALAYVWRIVETLYSGGEGESLARAEAPVTMLLGACLLAALNVLFGFVPALPMELASSAASALMGHTQ